MFKIIIQFNLYSFFFCDAIHAALVYFYFTRYIIPGNFNKKIPQPEFDDSNYDNSIFFYLRNENCH